jgi:hypothetical protein
MTNDPQSLSLAILCLVMVVQIFLMAHWHRAMQREGNAAIAETKHVLRSWKDHGKRHVEVNRELAYQGGHVSRLELAMVALVQRIPNLQIDDSNLREFFDGEPTQLPHLTSPFPPDEDWEQHQAKQTLLGLNPSSGPWQSGLEPAPDGPPVTKRTPQPPSMTPEFTCQACGADVFFQQVPGPCPQCGAARPS